MQSLETLLQEAETAHGHLCAGQILGVRMAMLGCERLGIADPRGLESPKDRKRLVTFVEIDRCATDAIAVVTGCRLGKRALKFRDWGKMAATFVDLGAPLATVGDTPSYKGIRIAALESSKQRAREIYPEVEDKNRQQMLAYRELPVEELFTEEWVRVPLHPREMPGYKSARVACSRCGEGINYDRQADLPQGDSQGASDVQGGPEGEMLCRACADVSGRYYQPLAG